MVRTSDDLLNSATQSLGRVRTTTPLVQCLTNTVTTNFVANALLAVGATPAMADLPGEAEVLAGVAGAVLLNLGTPGADQRAAMLGAAGAANDAGTAWVLDPVAVGTLPVRTALAHELLALRPTVIRGNASEIRALAGQSSGGRGVDSVDTVDAARQAAIELARGGSIVAVSGVVDLVTDGEAVVHVAGGDELLTRITGAGCALGAVTAAFVAVSETALDGAVAACTVYAVAAEIAARTSPGPGSFAVALLDALAAVDEATVRERGGISA